MNVAADEKVLTRQQDHSDPWWPLSLPPQQYVGSKDIRWQKSYAVQHHLPMPSTLTEHLRVPGHVLGAGVLVVKEIVVAPAFMKFTV